jgi:hypothetical protein
VKDFIGTPVTNVGSFFSVPPARQPVGMGNGLKAPRKLKRPTAMKPRAPRGRAQNAGNQKVNKYT